VPVEDETGRLVGLVTHRGLLHLLSTRKELGAITVKDIMVPDPFTVSPLTPTLEAIATMRERRVGCLPVIEGGQLVGIVTSYDFLEASARLFQEHLGRTIEPAKTRTMAQTA
jgi:CBS domain-containing protein